MLVADMPLGRPTADRRVVGWTDLRREPFRVFFPLAVVFSCFGVGHWLAYALGWRQSYSGFYHASLQTGVYMTCFIVGFLLTALPRFAAAAPASSLELGLALGLMGGQAAALWARQWVMAQGCFAGLLILLAVFAIRRFAKRRATAGPPAEFVWILTAIFLGLLGSVMLTLGQLEVIPRWLLGVAKPMVQQGFVLGIVLGVGGFMAPRVMGRESVLIAPVGASPGQATCIRRRRIVLHGFAGGAFAASFVIEGLGAASQAYVVRAAIVTAELAWTTQVFRPPAIRVLYVRLLWWSLWLLVLGLWLAGILPTYRVAMVHLAFLGGLGLMTFAVGTMVVLSHAGQARLLNQPLWVLRIVGLGIAGTIAARLMAELQPEWFFQWLGVAAGCWLVAGSSWLGFILPRIVQPLAPGAFEQVHEDAKRRLLKTSATID